jgi:hypothetical protein
VTKKRRGKGARAPSAAQRPLLEALRADRADRALWSVLGDLLQTEGDPRGALVSLMLEREARPSAQLLEAERRYRAEHLAKLVPELDEEPAAITWWRGFPSQLRVTSIEMLERAVRDPALQFLDAVSLEPDPAEWADWLEVLDGRPQAWRWLQLEPTSSDDPLELTLAPLFEALPALEALRVAFPEDEPGQLDGTAARAERLRLLALHNLEHLETLEADLPVLTELRLLGSSEATDGLRESSLWRRLRRVVINVGEYGAPSPSAADAGPVIHHMAATDREWFTTAFMVVAQRIEPALLGELAARMTGLDHLEAAVAHVPWHRLPMTAIRLRGAGATQLLPYGLGRAIEHHLTPPPAIALFSFSCSVGTAEAAVLGSAPRYRRVSSDAGETLVRDTLDAAFGCDPGPDALALLLEELDCAEPRMLLGTAGPHLELLAEIDPSVVPVPRELDEFQDDEPLWHERDLRTDRYLDEYDDPPEVTATERSAPPDAPPGALDDPAAEPDAHDGRGRALRVDRPGALDASAADPDIPAAAAAAAAVAVVDVAGDGPASGGDPGEDSALGAGATDETAAGEDAADAADAGEDAADAADAAEAADVDVETADGLDAWARVDELGAEQGSDPDADTVEARWPDPELAWVDFVDAATLSDRAICTRCEEPGSLRACTSCGARHCTSCAVEDERGSITCAGCIAEAESPPPTEPPPPAEPRPPDLGDAGPA